jgi:hypothetical protein
MCQCRKIVGKKEQRGDYFQKLFISIIDEEEIGLFDDVSGKYNRGGVKRRKLLIPRTWVVLKRLFHDGNRTGNRQCLKVGEKRKFPERESYCYPLLPITIGNS